MQIQPTSYTPTVDFNEETGVFEIQGRSFPENAKDFYLPVLSWLTDFIERVEGKIIYKINLEYFNTASSKFLLETMNLFEKMMTQKNADVLIEWVYVEGDEDMKEAGEEFAQIVKVPFTYIELPND